MKMRKQVFGALCALLAAAVSAADEAVCLATVEFASLSELQRKMTAFGQMTSNPMVPMMVMASLQQQLTQEYGKLRADAPMTLCVYMDGAAYKAACAGKTDALEGKDDAVESVLVYPSAVKPATMLLNHPGATKDADGAIHLLAREDHPEERTVVFTEDGLFCAFAKNAAQGRQALADFARARTARAAAKKKQTALVSGAVTEKTLTLAGALEKLVAQPDTKGLPPWMAALTELNRRQTAKQFARLRDVAALEFRADYDNLGLTVAVNMKMKPGAKPLPGAGAALPPAAFDAVPAASPLFVAFNDRAQLDFADEAEFRKTLEDLAGAVEGMVAGTAKKDKNAKKYEKLTAGLAAVLRLAAKESPFPGEKDWWTVALGLAADRAPYLTAEGESADALRAAAVVEKETAALKAALDAQWPGQTVFTAVPGGFEIDWPALLDLTAKESGVKNAEKEMAAAKRTVTAALGGTVSAYRMTVSGARSSAGFAPKGALLPVAAAGAGEARVRAALPEMETARPSTVAYIGIYALARELVLPVMAQTAAKKDAAQWQAMLDALPPAAPNSALVIASRAGTDGTADVLLRLTAGELKNYSAAFNAFMAASLISGAGADDGDDE